MNGHLSVLVSQSRALDAQLAIRLAQAPRVIPQIPAVYVLPADCHPSGHGIKKFLVIVAHPCTCPGHVGQCLHAHSLDSTLHTEPRSSTRHMKERLYLLFATTADPVCTAWIYISAARNVETWGCGRADDGRTLTSIDCQSLSATSQQASNKSLLYGAAVAYAHVSMVMVWMVISSFLLQCTPWSGGGGMGLHTIRNTGLPP